MKDNELKVFSGSSNPELAKKICKAMDIELGALTTKKFSDGEIWVRFDENIRGQDVFIIQSTGQPADNLIELLIIIDAAKRSSAGRITVVLPYYGYARQDRKDQPRVPISARLFMDMIVKAGANRIIAMDLHSMQIQGYVNIPFDHLFSRPALMKHFREHGLFDDPNLMVVSPDMGSVARSRSLAMYMQKGLAIIDKRRTSHNNAEAMNIIGDVKGKRCLIFDDMADTAGTLVAAAKHLKMEGASEVICAFTHAVLSGPAIERLKNSEISKIYTTDTIALPKEKILPNMEIVSVASILAASIQRSHVNESISDLFYEFKVES
ncbi:MAG: ribose-phosphate pyrophosphokinase [Candidatus Marinimicrobia bacterium]|nr:ribose-phosphate pyrophosphokinase [Candidatus Neomarinimicrobiota bacterium]